MSQPQPAATQSQLLLVTENQKTVHAIALSATSPSITALQRATAEALSLPASTFPSLTFHYRDEEGDEVRMDTTAELVEVLREKAAAGEPLLLVAGLVNHDAAAAVSDADSDDSDSFVRVEASDCMASHSPSSAAGLGSTSPAVPSSPHAGRSVSEPEAQSQLAPTVVDETQVADASPATQPSSPPAASVTPAIAAVVRPAVDSPSQPKDVAQQAPAPLTEAEVKQEADVDEKQQQPISVQPSSIPPNPSAPALCRNSSPPELARHYKVAQTPAFARPFVANVNRQLRKARLLVDTVGHRWLADVQRVAVPRLRQVGAVSLEGLRVVTSAVWAWRGLSTFVAGLVIVSLLLGCTVEMGRQTIQKEWVHRQQRLSPYLRTLAWTAITAEQEQQATDDWNKLDFAATFVAWLDPTHQRLQTMEAQLHQQQLEIHVLRQQLDLYKAEVELLVADSMAKPTAGPSTQQWTHGKSHIGRSWLADNEREKEAAYGKKRDSRTEPASLYGDSIDDMILASVFGLSKEVQQYETQQPTEQRNSKTETRRSTTASSSPSHALWGEPSRLASSAAWSSPSAAYSHASAGATHSTSASSTSSSASASSALYDTERQSARAERAERRERRRQEREREEVEREMADSIWAMGEPADETHYKSKKPAAAAATTSSAAASSSHSHSSTSTSSRSHRADKASPHRSDWWTNSGSSSSCGKHSHKTKEKALKHVGKKIGKALQTVNDAAKRVWKAWKSQW